MSKPKKNFGQNFLIDQIVLGRIIDALSLVNGEQVLEIGCGKGALTERMLMKGINLINKLLKKQPTSATTPFFLTERIEQETLCEELI